MSTLSTPAAPLFDRHLRRVKDRALGPLGRWAGRFASPDSLTWAGFACGLGSAWAAWSGAYGWGFLLLAINRLFDGIDGPAARATGRQSDYGGLLDIVLDFAAYAAIAVGLALGRPTGEGVLPAALIMMATFYVNAAAWIYLAAILEKRALGASNRGDPTSVAVPEGLIGGTESMIAYAAFFVFPSHLRAGFAAFAMLVAITAVQRMVWARRQLR